MKNLLTIKKSLKLIKLTERTLNLYIKKLLIYLLLHGQQEIEPNQYQLKGVLTNL